MQAKSTCLNSGGCPALGSLSCLSWKPGQVSRHGEPPCPRWKFSLKRRGRVREKERERVDKGETSLSSDWPNFYCPERLFILLVVHKDQWIIQNYAASAALTAIETRLSLCIPSCIHKSQVIYINFQPEGQLKIYGHFLIRVCQPENIFALIVLFFPNSGAILRKYQIKLHSYIARTQQFITMKEEYSDL